MPFSTGAPHPSHSVGGVPFPTSSLASATDLLIMASRTNARWCPLIVSICSNSNSKRYTYPCVHSSTIHNSQDIETTQMSINGWMKTTRCVPTDTHKTTMKYHLTPGRMAIIKKSTNKNCCRECGEVGDVSCCSHYGGEQHKSSLKKTKHRITD